jgi:hypothetical protein
VEPGSSTIRSCPRSRHISRKKARGKSEESEEEIIGNQSALSDHQHQPQQCSTAFVLLSSTTVACPNSLCKVPVDCFLDARSSFLQFPANPERDVLQEKNRGRKRR